MKQFVIVVKAMCRSRARLRRPHQSMGSFFYFGPADVGKMKISKALAEQLFHEENQLPSCGGSLGLVKQNIELFFHLSIVTWSIFWLDCQQA